ncbi:GntR family transcriptional regulator [Actinomadura sp. ATCC 31491]|uniref:GntR family transcriptional regulator n=1 Tax=Actinomadura luzonensis TaxID=2805427 RepID=A0ABT0FPR2_9ACTN|nr:GntR family transcriptional regulator [Actinomadura luzonensis]MCK2214314.1 GntR family transcriptional regulator [Actinomadura luzonensis]
MVPPFRRIADDLRTEILDGRLAPGEKLPSENDLASRYDTTRTTVRKAIALLRAEGHVVSSQGAKTHVRKRPAIMMVSTGTQWRSRREGGIASLNVELADQGFNAEQRLVEVTQEPASGEVAAALGLSGGQAVIVRRREVLVDGEPIQLSDGYYPADLFARTPVAEARRIKGGVAGYYEDVMGGRIARFVEQVSIRMPTPGESATLRIPPGVPIARTLRIAYDGEGRAVELLDSVVPGDAITFEYVIDVPPPKRAQEGSAGE